MERTSSGSAAHTFVVEAIDALPRSLTALEARAAGAFPLAHLERPGPAMVAAVLAAAVAAGHATPLELRRPGEEHRLGMAATVNVMSRDGFSVQRWGVPTRESLAWWITVTDIRSVSREDYFAAFSPAPGERCA